MIDKKLTRCAVALSTVLIFSGCNMTAVRLIEDQLPLAQQDPEFALVMYQEVQTGRYEDNRLNDKDKAYYLTTLGQMLARQKRQEITGQLKQERLDAGEVPLSVLAAEIEKTLPIQDWDVAQYAEIIALLDQERAKTDEAIKASKTLWDQHESLQFSVKYKAINRLIALHGSANKTELAQDKEQLLADNYDFADNLVSRREFIKAIEHLEVLVEIIPNYRPEKDKESVKQKLAELERNGLPVAFARYVDNGEMAQAQTMLNTMATKETLFDEQRSQLRLPATTLLRHYIAEAVSANQQHDLVNAYDGFKKARELKTLFGDQDKLGTEESEFIGRIDGLYQAAAERELYGLALGYLAVIEALNPSFTQLSDAKKRNYDRVNREAVKTLRIMPFTGSGTLQSASADIVTAVINYIRATIPQDVRIMESDATMSNRGEDSNLIDFKIKGNVAGNITTSPVEHFNKTKWEKTGVKRVKNPAHTEWVATPKRERTKSEPERMINVDKMETIIIKGRREYKAADLNVSYRMLDLVSNDIIETDVVIGGNEDTATSYEEVTSGIYHQDEVTDTLLSNSKLWASLLKTQVPFIAIKIIAKLKNSELEYEALGKKWFKAGDYTKAAKEMAKAVVMAQSKHQDTRKLLGYLRQYAVSVSVES